MLLSQAKKLTILVGLLLMIHAVGISMQPVIAQSDGCSPEQILPPFSIHQFEVDGQTRSYHIYVPPTYAPDTPTPLVMSFHGAGSQPIANSMVTAWHVLGNQEGFITVYPQGINGRWNGGHEAEPEVQAIDDLSFVNAMLDRLKEQLCIDDNQIFATGFSNGSGMAMRLACDLSNRITAVGVVSGLYSSGYCDSVEPIPAILFHGTDDPITLYTGGPSDILPLQFTDDEFISVEAGVDQWANRNGCDDEPANLSNVEGVTGWQYSNCDDSSNVLFYSIDGGGHTWPGSPVDLQRLMPIPMGETTQDIDATVSMWDFFSKKAKTLKFMRMGFTR